MPELIEINPRDIFHETGNCYKYKLSEHIHEGEKIGSDYISSLQVFENGKLLGPGSSAHETIRNIGKGAYSHWNRELYFSTSDNSNPAKNKRKYFVVAPLKTEKAIDYNKLDCKNSEFFHYVLWKNAFQNNTELHTIATLKGVLYLLSNIQYEIQNKIILEVGANPTLGLDLTLLLLGAKKVIVNNILPLPEKLPLQLVKNIYFFLKLMDLPVKNLEEVLEIQDSECFFKKSFIEIYGNLSAKELKLTESPDLILSTSVLEHIRDLDDVLKNLYSLSNSNTIHIHSIDARDHTNYKEPLKYLRYSEKEFLELYSEEHNRTRYFEYLNSFENAKLSVFKKKYIKPLPITPFLNVDIYEILFNGLENYYVDSIEELPICVSEQERNSLDPKYRVLSLQELSTQVFVFYAKAEK